MSNTGKPSDTSEDCSKFTDNGALAKSGSAMSIATRRPIRDGIDICRFWRLTGSPAALSARKLYSGPPKVRRGRRNSNAQNIDPPKEKARPEVAISARANRAFWTSGSVRLYAANARHASRFRKVLASPSSERSNLGAATTIQRNGGLRNSLSQAFDAAAAENDVRKIRS